MPGDDFESRLESALRELLASPSVPPNLAESIRYSLLGPGKRIRPRLAFAAAALLGLGDEAVAPAAVALEMVHCFTLIHDDLPCMDDDDLRRGRPSNHKVHGEALALLAGDALEALAFEALGRAALLVPPERVLAATLRLARSIGAAGVIGGQAAEMLLGDHSALDELLAMHARKTGALFEAAILVPRDLSGLAASEPAYAALEYFARELGLAFQIADDLEDAESDVTSILHYIDAPQARSLAHDRLKKAAAHLREKAGPACAELDAIASEVLMKLDRAHPGAPA